MIAEIHHKISASGSNLNDRREDLLTGDIFGSLRYVPFTRGYLPVLRQTIFRSPIAQQLWLDTIRQCNSENTDIRFWQSLDGHEIDLVIHGPNESLLGFEVKYLSWLSSDDDVSFAEETMLDENRKSINQLAEYACSLEKRSANSFLVLVAPKDKGNYIVDDVFRRKLIPSRVHFGLLLWESVYQALLELHASATTCPERLLYEDLIALLEKRDLQTFTGWNMKETVTEGSYLYSSKVIDLDWSLDCVRGNMSYEFEA